MGFFRRSMLANGTRGSRKTLAPRTRSGRGALGQAGGRPPQPGDGETQRGAARHIEWVMDADVDPGPTDGNRESGEEARPGGSAAAQPGEGRHDEGVGGVG